MGKTKEAREAEKEETAAKIKQSKKKLIMGPQQVENASSSLYAGTYQNVDEPWTVSKLKTQLRVQGIKFSSPMDMEFDLIGVDPSIANAFRRILLAEVPSMAIEKAGIYQNTSVIPDEVLAHRLGLIPLKADAKHFEYKDGDNPGTEQDTLRFSLKIKCSWNPKRTPETSNPDEMYINHKVYSSDIKWEPIGSQSSMYKEKEVGPVHPDILIAKLRPGHELDIILEAVKGIPKDHSKFCAVATAFYRLLPEITLKELVTGEKAERLQSCFSPGVIQIADINGVKTAKVDGNGSRNDSCSRNVLRHEDLEKCVVLSRVKDHFIFSIEAAGGVTPDKLFIEAVKILKAKTRKYLGELQALNDD